MAIQLHTFAKLSGKTGDAAYQKIKHWSHLEAEADRKDKLFPRGRLPEVARFVKSLRQNPTEPSLLHFVEFLDTWSVSTSSYQPFSHLPAFPRFVNAGHSLAAYQLPDNGALQAVLAKELRRNRIKAIDQEARLFALNLLETVRAYELVCPAATIIMIRTSLTGSFTDDEIARASKTPASWLKP